MNKQPDQVTLTRRVITLARRLDLPFMETLRIEGYRRGEPEPVWTAQYDRATLAEEMRSLRVRTLDPDGRNCILSGLIVGLILTGIPLTRAILGAWIVLVHELGHAIPSWFFGYLAIPTFDFIYGGGITLNLGRIPMVSPLIFVGLGYLCYRYRQNPPTQRLCGGAMLLYGLASSTPIHVALITAMGHGGELLAIALCLYFALGRYFCARTGERFLLALLGWFTLFNLWAFSSQLVFSAAARIEYEGGKGGLLDNDLVVLANQYHLFGVVPLALLLMGLGGGAIALSAIAFRYELWWTTALHQRLIRNP